MMTSIYKDKYLNELILKFILLIPKYSRVSNSTISSVLMDELRIGYRKQSKINSKLNGQQKVSKLS